MLIANKIEVPDECPKDCPGHKSSMEQGGLCHRCPIFNCSLCDDVDEYGSFRLVEPEDYREEWALEYVEMWKSGKYPQLRL